MKFLRLVTWGTVIIPYSAGAAFAQATGQPPEQSSQLPPVTVIQPKEKAAERKVRKKAATRPRVPREARQGAEPAESAAAAAEGEADLANTVDVSPVPGSSIPLNKVPGGVSQVSGAAVQSTGTSTAQEALAKHVPGVSLSDQQGNTFQTEVYYRGFLASPVNGTAQGLAVYQNGVRINEVFGDIVNWDFLPSNAISSMTVVSGNPLFGLNALGGAINVKMKDGFEFQGVESDSRFGSYGRRQEGLQFGTQAGNIAAYVGGEVIHDGGWRMFSPSDVRRLYADVGVRTSPDSEFHVNYSRALNFVGVAASTPVELLDQKRSKVFTTPQTTLNRVDMVSLNGVAGLTPDLKLSGVTYYRRFRQKHVDGNISEVEPCGADDTKLCLDGDIGDSPDPIVKDRNGNAFDNIFGDETIGETDRTKERSNSYGASLQLTSIRPIFGHPNQFTLGGSIDHGVARTGSWAELGTIDPNTLAVSGSGLFPYAPLSITPTDLKSTTNYYSVFFSNTFDLTSRLAVTGGGRYNIANIDLEDRAEAFKLANFGPGTSLTGDHTYVRFNPSIGATYKLTPEVALYGGYSEANRAPTPAELGCADPSQPCLLANFLTVDPELKQVVSHTWELGVRGNGPVAGYGKLGWSVGLFHTLNTDDIILITDESGTRGYFKNAGETLRQGVEASVTYHLPRALFYANYALVDATFQSNLTLPSPDNPLNVDPDGEVIDEDHVIHVRPGHQLPLVPQHRLKLGFDYLLTERWKAGADVIYTGSQYFRGDEANQNDKLPDYWLVNLHTSYRVSKNIEIYGIVNNVFDEKYAVYGAYFPPEEAGISLTNPRSVTPGTPLAAYGGLKIKFGPREGLESELK